MDLLTLTPMLASIGSIMSMILYVLFFILSLALITIILLQEGKGGGFASAFGGVGTEAFGVKAGGINKLTAVLAGLFVLSALLIGMIGSNDSVSDRTESPTIAAPAPGAGAPGGAPTPPPPGQ